MMRFIYKSHHLPEGVASRVTEAKINNWLVLMDHGNNKQQRPVQRLGCPVNAADTNGLTALISSASQKTQGVVKMGTEMWCRSSFNKWLWFALTIYVVSSGHEVQKKKCKRISKAGKHLRILCVPFWALIILKGGGTKRPSIWQFILCPNCIFCNSLKLSIYSFILKLGGGSIPY